MPMRSWHCAANMRMRKVKWATDYLPTASCLVKEPSKQAGNWKKLLDTDTLHIEIGCGKGNYSLDMAKMYPDTGFIAIEEDASSIGEWFGPREVDVIHLNFSDPWPKKRYAKRRLSSATFLDQYKRILSFNGEIQMKTDNSALFEYSLIEFQNAGFKMVEISVDYRREKHDEDAITEYEQKFISLGQPIYRCVWRYAHD